MKKIKIYFIIAGVFFISAIIFTSCDEDELLTEIPKDFYSPENSYITENHFQMAVNNLYYDLMYLVWGSNDDSKYALYYATDFAYNATNYKPGQLGKLNDYTNVMIPNFAVPLNIWTYC